MSRETLEHLNINTLIGNTDNRGTAWHYRAEHQGDQSNHYPGPIPVVDVEGRLFDWQGVSRRVAVEVPTDATTMTQIDDEGVPMHWSVIEDRQAICRSDTHAVMGIFALGYSMHQYREWLLTTVADILDDDLSVSSAGLLRGGAVAWVEVSVPESITTPEGVVFRPNLLATTSFDGSIATTFKRTITDVVCDNTREAALAETGQTYKIKHSRHSHAQLAPAREALVVVHTLADDFAREVAGLCATTVTEQQWGRFLDAYVSRVDKGGLPLKGRALTLADKKRDALQRLYRHDVRVSPWAGSAHGVVQAINTFEHHESTIRGAARAERNMLRAITGDFGRLDRTTLSTLNRVLA
jgi:phage/plasmid-like protein (TIGR03299 family)